MKKIYLIATIVALITALVVFMFASNLQKAALEASKVPTTPVAVATMNISANSIINEDMVVLRELPTTAVTPGTARTVEELIGKIVKYPITAGEQIVTSKLKTQGSTAGTDLSYQLKEGERAITISVDEITGISGFIRAGDYVDIITTESENNVPVTKYLFENVKVLKVSTKSANLSGGDIPSYGCITICLTPDDALIIGNALNLGMQLRLTLRPVTDNAK